MLGSFLTHLLWVLHLLSCVLLIIVVLLQSGRGSGVAGLFGGGGGDSPFGAKTGTFLGKVTGGMAAFYILSAVVLALLSAQSGTSTVEIDESDIPVNVQPEEAGTGGAVEMAPAQPEADMPEVEAPDVEGPAEETTEDAQPTGCISVPLGAKPA